MALADIYVLDHIQSFNNEPIHNIYTFEAISEGSALDLINAFEEDILPSVQLMQCDDLRTEALKAYSLGNLADLNEKTIGTGGGNTSADMLPVFNAVNFSLKPTSRAVRPGSKRIAGVPETVQVNGTITEGGYLTFMENLRVAYGNEVSTDDVNFYRLVIVKRVLYDVPDTDPVRQAYRFPVSDEELVFAALRNVTTTTKVSHQVSRGN
jgi:hypothetical protein